MSKPIKIKNESKVLSVRVGPELLAAIEQRALDLGILNPFAADGSIKPNVSAYLIGLARADLGLSDTRVSTVDATVQSINPDSIAELQSTIAALAMDVEALKKPAGVTAA